VGDRTSSGLRVQAHSAVVASAVAVAVAIVAAVAACCQRFRLEIAAPCRRLVEGGGGGKTGEASARVIKDSGEGVDLKLSSRRPRSHSGSKLRTSYSREESSLRQPVRVLRAGDGHQGR
jgi:hypothetical protein